MGLKEIVENYSATLSRNYEQAAISRNDAKSRLVWFVAISGFAMLNAKPFWESLHVAPLQSHEIFWLSVPWAITALVAIITHIIMDELTIRGNMYYSTKRDALDLHSISVAEGKVNFDEFKGLLHDTDPAIKTLRADLDRWFKIAQRFEKLTFLAMSIAFISAIAMPLVFR